MPVKSRPVTPTDKLDLEGDWSAASLPRIKYADANQDHGVWGPATVSFTCVFPSSAQADLDNAAPEQLLIVLREKGGFLHSFPQKTSGELLPGRTIAYDSGEKVESFYERGLVHRADDSPAYVARAANGEVVLEEYCRRGELHRDGGKPAALIYDAATKIVRAEGYYVGGVPHRDGDEPAELSRDASGAITNRAYYRHGEFLRADPPSEPAAPAAAIGPAANVTSGFHEFTPPPAEAAPAAVAPLPPDTSLAPNGAADDSQQIAFL